MYTYTYIYIYIHIAKHSQRQVVSRLHRAIHAAGVQPRIISYPSSRRASVAAARSGVVEGTSPRASSGALHLVVHKAPSSYV